MGCCLSFSKSMVLYNVSILNCNLSKEIANCPWCRKKLLTIKEGRKFVKTSVEEKKRRKRKNLDRDSLETER